MPHLYIVIPAYNEGRNIGEVLRQLQELGSTLPLSVILVNDGSRDNTLAEAGRYLGTMDLQVIDHPVNQGIPRTFQDGLLAAAHRSTDEGDGIVIMEGDGTSDLALLPEMARQIEAGSDLVVASRYLQGGGYLHFPAVRTWGSNGVNHVLRILLRLRGVTDYTIFFRAYRAGIVKQAIERYGEGLLTGRSFAANLELLLKLQRYIGKSSEVPLVYDYQLKKGASSMNIGKTLAEYRPVLWRYFSGEY